jgi:hypothetical protein
MRFLSRRHVEDQRRASTIFRDRIVLDLQFLVHDFDPIPVTPRNVWSARDKTESAAALKLAPLEPMISLSWLNHTMDSNRV